MTVSGYETPRGEPEIALVVSRDRWVDALHRHCADHGGARVRVVVLDPKVALDERFDVLVTSDRWPSLTSGFVETLHRCGRRVLVVGDAPHLHRNAARVGADAVLESRASSEDIVACVAALVPEVMSTGAPPSTTVPSTAAVDRGAPAIRMVAVGGPFGAGSTEVAVALAASWTGTGRPVLVDADEVTPSVAARLGLPIEPNLCDAIDAVNHGLGAVPGTLFDLGAGWPAVLVGPPNRRSAAAIRPTDAVTVVRALAERFDPVVVDVSNGARAVHGDVDIATTVVAEAFAVVAVATATPVGVLRLIDWVRALALGADTPVHVVANRSSGSRRRQAEIETEIRRAVPVASVAFAPADARVDEASWSASLAERGPFLRVVSELRERILLPGTARDTTSGGCS